MARKTGCSSPLVIINRQVDALRVPSTAKKQSFYRVPAPYKTILQIAIRDAPPDPHLQSGSLGRIEWHYPNPSHSRDDIGTSHPHRNPAWYTTTQSVG